MVANNCSMVAEKKRSIENNIECKKFMISRKIQTFHIW
jgi:hypothetical protein